MLSRLVYCYPQLLALSTYSSCSTRLVLWKAQNECKKRAYATDSGAEKNKRNKVVRARAVEAEAPRSHAQAAKAQTRPRRASVSGLDESDGDERATDASSDMDDVSLQDSAMTMAKTTADASLSSRVIAQAKPVRKADTLASVQKSRKSSTRRTNPISRTLPSGISNTVGSDSAADYKVFGAEGTVTCRPKQELDSQSGEYSSSLSLSCSSPDLTSDDDRDKRVNPLLASVDLSRASTSIISTPRNSVVNRLKRTRSVQSIIDPKKYYIFLDLETNDAALSPSDTRILEIAVCVANETFEPMDDGVSSLVHWPSVNIAELESEMPSNVREMHQKLLADYAHTPLNERRTLAEVERLVCSYLQRHGLFEYRRQGLMSGAGTAYDRNIVRALMPKLDTYFLYQTFDTTSLWHIIRRRFNRDKRFENNSTHRAMDDIKGSMREAKMYLDTVFKSPDDVQWPF